MKNIGKQMMRVQSISGRTVFKRTRPKGAFEFAIYTLKIVKNAFTTVKTESSTTHERKLGSIFVERMAQKTPHSI